MGHLVEYNIIFATGEKTGRKPCCIREQILGIANGSERDFGNFTCELEPVCIVRASLEHELQLKYQHLSFLGCFLLSSVYVCQWFREISDFAWSKENLLVIQVSVCYILKHVEDKKA